MAHFYVECSGSRGAVSRLGGAGSGVRATLAGWNGGVSVRLYHRNGIDCVRIERTTWNGSGTPGLLYDGPVNTNDQAEFDAIKGQ